jgi:flagellar biosynthesis protein FlhG
LNWEQARNLLRLGRMKRSEDFARGSVAGSHDVAPKREFAQRPGFADRSRQSTGPQPLRCASSVCIASGKGGTGKSLITASLARLFAARGRTLLFDADLGCANAHILHDVHPAHSFIDVVEGRLAVREILTSCGNGLDLLPGGSGFARLAGLTSFELHLVARGLEELETAYRFLLVDSAAGLSNQTVEFARACDLVLLVVTPDITSITDAYAFLKVFVRRNPRGMPLLVVNRCTAPDEAEHVARRLSDVTRKFLGRDLALLAALPEDRGAFRCTQRRTTVVEGEPEGPLAGALRWLERCLLDELGRTPARGAGTELVRAVGYSEA